MHLTNNSIAIIGAGIGGLAAALRLSDAGLDVTVFDSASDVGGKMRTVASAAGPIDAGPTVFTMRHVFEKLFDDVGESLGDHLTLTPAKILARHYWSDGSMLDLMANPMRPQRTFARGVAHALKKTIALSLNAPAFFMKRLTHL